MSKSEKPGIQNFSGILRLFFARVKGPALKNLVKNPRWVAKPAAAVSAPERQLTDPAARFRKLTSSRAGVYTPLQDMPVAKIPPALQPPSEPDPTPQPAAQTAPVRKPFFQLSKTLPAFWTVASIISLLVNIILIIALALVGRQLFVLKSLVGDKLLGGLYENFIYMDQAHITTEINVTDTIPISFSLPISQDTIVTLSQDTPISGANVRINTGTLMINSPANIILPAGTNLPIHLELNVPVTTNVPVNIKVPVDIPLEQTELHKPFIGLQQVVAPFYDFMQPGVKGPEDLSICKPFSQFCSFYFTP